MAECFASFRRGRGVCGGCSNDVVSAGRAEGKWRGAGSLSRSIFFAVGPCLASDVWLSIMHFIVFNGKMVFLFSNPIFLSF